MKNPTGKGRRGKEDRRPDGRYRETHDPVTEAQRIAIEIKAIDQLPNEGKRRIDLILSSDLHTALRVGAAKLDLSIPALVKRQLGHALGQQQRPIEQRPTDKRRLPIEIPITLYKAIKINALIQGLSPSEYVSECLRKGST